MMLLFLARVGATTRQLVADIGHATMLFVRLVMLGPACLRRFGLVRDHMHFLGNYSLAIIAVSGLFVGFVLALQGYNTLQRFGSASALGMLVALSLVRELGPVVSALLFTGRAGTSLTAEIGLMKAGEQLSAMEMMAIDPVQRILAPRFWAGVLVMPILGAIFSAVGIIGGWLVGRVQDIRFDDKSFQAKVFLAMDTQYLFPKDSSLKILTSGLLGEQYIGIEAGADSANLAHGDKVQSTQSAVVLENLISRFLYDKAAAPTEQPGGH